MFENDYTITGKHATYLKYMAAKNAKDDENAATSSARLFERYIDVYMNAAIWGLLYSRTAPKDNSSDKSVDIESEERINRAFRYDTQPEKAEAFRQNMDVFHDYVRGGIELMYEEFTDGCSTREDYLNKVFEVMTTFKKEIEGFSYEDELAQLIR